MKIPQVRASTYGVNIDLGLGKAQEIAKAMNINLDEAKALIQRAVSDPVGFQKQQRLISRMREEPDKRPVKAWQLRHTKESVGRNSPCPCGSGKKFKKCCINADRYIGVIVHRGEIQDGMLRAEAAKKRPRSHR